MPPDLFKARQKLDAAVDAAFSKKKFSSDTDYVAFLFELYQQILSPLEGDNWPQIFMCLNDLRAFEANS